VAGQVEVDNAATIMGQHQEHVEAWETDCGHSEEIDGDELCDVVLQEGAPGLRRGWRQRTMYLVTLLSPMSMPSFEQLAVNPGCTPAGILSAHPADQIPKLAGDLRPSRLSPPKLPSPKPAKALAMPSHNRFRLDDD
jgi:hypothetical protein